MSYNFSSFKQSISELEEWLKKEFAVIRTGRANISVLDGVLVEMYGSRMPINQLATISTEDVRVIRVVPWDKSSGKEIEKAITMANLGLSVTVDDKGLRIIFPELTSDRRVSFVKMAKQKLEDAKVTLRNEREKVIKDIDNKQKEGQISEDDKFRLKNDLQKIVDEAGKNLEAIFVKKEKEILE